MAPDAQGLVGKTRVERGVKSCGKDIKPDQAVNGPGTALLEMAVSRNSIYFYNNTGVKIVVNRNTFSPKSFKK